MYKITRASATQTQRKRQRHNPRVPCLVADSRRPRGKGSNTQLLQSRTERGRTRGSRAGGVMQEELYHQPRPASQPIRDGKGPGSSDPLGVVTSEYACVEMERPTEGKTRTPPPAESSAQADHQYRTDHCCELWGRGEHPPPPSVGCWTSSGRPGVQTQARGGGHHPGWTLPTRCAGEAKRDGSPEHQIVGVPATRGRASPKTS